MFKVESCKNPTWADKDQKGIHCIVKFDNLLVEVPFIAMPNDAEKHGRDLFGDLIGLKYGPISAYVPPPPTRPGASASVGTHKV